MKIRKITFASFIAIILSAMAIFSLSKIQNKECISTKDEMSSEENILIAIEKEFFSCLCEDRILRAGYDCTYPQEFDLKSKENDPGKNAAFKKGVEICEKEARNGSLYDQECLTHYFNFIDKDKKKALYWANKSAEQGSSNGMMVLWSAYWSGEGVLEDRSECMKWIFLAKAAGNTEAKKIIRNLKEITNFEEISYVEIGRLKSEQWVNDHPEAFFEPEI